MQYRTSRIPVYKQISDILKQEIVNQYNAGDCIPAELNLANRFSVNRHTVRQAVNELVQEGLVIRMQGKGTIVQDMISYPINSKTRFTENLSSAGKHSDCRVVRKMHIRASEQVAKKLLLKPNIKILLIETLRFVENDPFAMITHFLPETYYQVYLDYESGSLHTFLNENFGLELVRSSSSITATLPTKEDAGYLKMPPNSPVLRVKSINNDAIHNIPIEYSVSRMRGDRVELGVTI
jgi:GntR family phosphonate transport system transcriptional regulator